MQLIKRVFLFVLCIIVINNTLAQDKKNQKLLNYVLSEMCYKSSIQIDNEQLQALDFYLGYKFKNKVSIGLCMGTTTKLNFDTDTFSWYVPMGLGVRYRLFEKKTNNAGLGFEPFLNLTSGTSFTSEEPGNDYLGYDLGVNFVAKECPYLLIGVGAGQLLYSNDENDLLNIFLSFGLRL